MPELNWGILGTGNIAGKFGCSLNAAPGQQLIAIASRSLASAEKFRGEVGVAELRCYGNYAEMLGDEQVQAVYIALPNHLHKEWAIRCAEAGKHVLCEKPLAVNRAQAEEMILAARQHDVFLMEAFVYRCHPMYLKLRELIAAGSIGEPRIMEGSFGYDMRAKWPDVNQNVRMHNAMGGGGLLDVGCYPVSLARMIAGCEPSACRAVAKIGESSRVDEWAAMSLEFPNGMLAALSCGMFVAMENTVTIFGSEGSIRLPVPWLTPGKQPSMILRGKNAAGELRFEAGVPLAQEALHVAENIARRQAPAMTWADSLGNMAALDALRRSVGLRFDCE
ncbi:MAG TPA: Gfo/Idh/MocA family oxidoreductase [Planctomycetota bacterium]|jgi:predicted dehydrogenase